MQQYGSLPYCVLPLSVLQYIAVLQCKFEKRTHHVFKTCFSSKGQVEACKIVRNCIVYLWLQEVQSFL